MPLPIERIKESKPYFFKVIQEYQKLETEIANIIDHSGFDSPFFAMKLNLPLSAFYYKRRTKSFTTNEIIQIINLLVDGDDDNLIDDEEDEDDE